MAILILVVPILVVAALVVLVVALTNAAKRQQDLRRTALFLLSQQLKLEFLPFGLAEPPPQQKGFLASLSASFGPTQDQMFLQRFSAFRPFGMGHGQDVQNLMVGTIDGLDWYLFDYSYKVTTSTGKTTTTVTHNNAVVAVRLPLLLPDLDLSPETVFQRLGAKLGLKELDFELEEFNRRYFVRSSDPKRAYELLHPKAIEFLMTMEVRQWQMNEVQILIYDSGICTPDTFLHLYQELQSFIALIPDYYRQDHSVVPAWRSPFD